MLALSIILCTFEHFNADQFCVVGIAIFTLSMKVNPLFLITSIKIALAVKVCLDVNTKRVNLNYWGEPERAPPGDPQLLRCLYNWASGSEPTYIVLRLGRAVYIYIYGTTDRIPYISKCFYALLFHRHLSTFHGTQYGPNGTREAGLLRRREGASRH